MSDVLMDLHNHYKAVRARLNAGPPKPLKEIEPQPEPAPAVVLPTPPLMAMEELGEAKMLYLMPCSYETRQMILPILKKHEMTWVQAMTKSQKSRFVRVRCEIYIVLSANGWSLTQIGRMCGGRDHTTILNSLKRFTNSYLSDEEKEAANICEISHVRYSYFKMKLRDHAYS